MRFKPFEFCLALLCVLVLSSAACTSGAPVKILEHSISVQEFTADITQSVATVTGVARNMGSWSVEDCTISATFHGYDGTNLGTLSETRRRVEPGEIWDFKIELKGADAWKVARYTVAASCK
jgi:hypothetical protein